MRIKTHLAKQYKTLDSLVIDGCKWNTLPDKILGPTYNKLINKDYWGSEYFRWDTYNKLGHCNNAENFDRFFTNFLFFQIH